MEINTDNSSRQRSLSAGFTGLRSHNAANASPEGSRLGWTRSGETDIGTCRHSIYPTGVGLAEVKKWGEGLDETG